MRDQITDLEQRVEMNNLEPIAGNRGKSTETRVRRQTLQGGQTLETLEERAIGAKFERGDDFEPEE